MKNIFINYNILIFYALLIIRYLISYLLYGDLYVQIHDNLDSDIVYNKVIGEFYRGGFDFDAFNIFLGGEIKWFYFIRVLQPMVLLYAIFTVKTAYFLTEIIVTSLAFYSMKSLLDSRSENLGCVSFFSIFYALSISYTTYGLGVACFPYVLNQISKPNKVDIKS